MRIELSSSQISLLKKVKPSERRKGGFQSLIVGLQEKVDKKDHTIDLSGKDIGRINRYANKYRNGGWQTYLRRIFSGSIL